MAACLRRVTMDDAEDILNWRNDERTRASSFNKGVIALSDHLKWLAGKLSDPACHMFIMTDGEEKVGNIRVDVRDGVGEISYMIAPACRGQGYGRKIIELIESQMPPEVTTLIGVTLKSNAASGRCFVSNGYSAEDVEDAIVYSKGIHRMLSPDFSL